MADGTGWYYIVVAAMFLLAVAGVAYAAFRLVKKVLLKAGETLHKAVDKYSNNRF